MSCQSKRKMQLISLTVPVTWMVIDMKLVYHRRKTIHLQLITTNKLITGSSPLKELKGMYCEAQYQ